MRSNGCQAVAKYHGGAIEDGMAASNKIAKEALEKADKLEKEAEEAKLLKEAEGLNLTVDSKDVAKMLGGNADRETTEKVLKALGAQVDKSTLLRVVGSEAAAEGSSEGQLEARAKEIQKANTGMTIEAAYVKACDENPDLYAAVDKELQDVVND